MYVLSEEMCRGRVRFSRRQDRRSIWLILRNKCLERKQISIPMVQRISLYAVKIYEILSSFPSYRFNYG